MIYIKNNSFLHMCQWGAVFGLAHIVEAWDEILPWRFVASVMECC